MTRFTQGCLALTMLPAVLAQGYQCGGIGWTGATTCAAGSVCTKMNNDYSQCIPNTSSASTAKYWFSFGDSYTETGFDINGTLPSDGNPLGNPPYPGFTAAGGENWIDYVTTTYNTSLLFTYNYAYGGATIDATLVKPGKSLSLTDQVNEYLSGAGTKPAVTPWRSSDALFSVWIGINDIGYSFDLSGDREQFSDTLLNAYFALVQKLVRPNTGARNFLFLNVPPIDRSPLMLAQPASSRATEETVIAGFNRKLAVKIVEFKRSNSGVLTWLWDANAAFTAILDHPTEYGFKDATSYGPGDGIFWGGSYHPSSAAHKIFGQEIGRLLRGTPW